MINIFSCFNSNLIISCLEYLEILLLKGISNVNSELIDLVFKCVRKYEMNLKNIHISKFMQLSIINSLRLNYNTLFM